MGSLRSQLIRLAHQNRAIKSCILPVIVTDGKVAMIKQPRTTNPAYEGNVMAIPTHWGTAGTINPANVAGYVADLWPRAKNGVAYILDNDSAIRSLNLTRLEREVLLRCRDMAAEDKDMAAEQYEDIAFRDKDRYEKIMEPYWDRVHLMDSQLQVAIEPYTSPKTGLNGLMVRFSLPYFRDK